MAIGGTVQMHRLRVSHLLLEQYSSLHFISRQSENRESFAK